MPTHNTRDTLHDGYPLGTSSRPLNDELRTLWTDSSDPDRVTNDAVDQASTKAKLPRMALVTPILVLDEHLLHHPLTHHLSRHPITRHWTSISRLLRGAHSKRRNNSASVQREEVRGLGYWQS